MSPSCTCCGGSGGDPVGECVRGGGGPTTTPPWFIKSGAWFNGGFFIDAYFTNSNNAVLIHDPTPPLPNWVNNFRFLSGILVENVRNQLIKSGHRLIFSWQNQSNFWFADLKYLSTISDQYSPTGTSTLYELKLAEMKAGQEITRHSMTFTFQNLFDLAQRPYAQYPTGMEVCLQNGWLTVSASSTAGSFFGGLVTGKVICQVSLTPPQGLFGVGSHSAATNNVGWSGAEIWIEKLPPIVCKKCPNGVCCEGYKLPETVTVTLTNMPTPYTVWNGSYIVPIFSSTESQQQNNPSGCFWEIINALPNPPNQTLYRNRIAVSRQPNTSAPDFGRATVNLTAEYTNAPAVVFTSTAMFRNSDPFSGSPCHDQWGNLPSFSMGGQAAVVGNL